MGKIVVAVDGSAHSMKVVDFAVGLAKPMQDDIVLIHVVPKTEPPEGYEGFARREGIDPHAYPIELGRRIIEGLAERVTTAKVACEEVCIGGHPSEEIIAAANEGSVDLVVMGLHGLHGLRRLGTLGSTSRRVVENSSIPVVIVP